MKIAPCKILQGAMFVRVCQCSERASNDALCFFAVY